MKDILEQTHASYIALYGKFDLYFPGEAGLAIYEEEYNIKINPIDECLMFKSEAHYTMFLLRWS
jgi:hypothetical protein